MRQVYVVSCRPWLEPVAAEIEKAAVGPVTRCQEEYEEEERAVEAWSVEKIGAQEEKEDEGRRSVCRDEEQREPTTSTT